MQKSFVTGGTNLTAHNVFKGLGINKREGEHIICPLFPFLVLL